MNGIISKKSLKQSIELISEIELEEEDINKIFEKFNTFFNNPEFKFVIEKISGLEEIENLEDMKELMNHILKNLSSKEIQMLLNKIIKNEDLIDFIQDLFLEKLI